MKEKLRQELTSLIQEGVRGQATRFKLRASRLAQLLQRESPELALAVTAGLVGAPMDLARDVSQSVHSADGPSPGLLELSHRVSLPHEPVWPQEVQQQLQSIVTEWTARDQLIEAGLHPARTVLLHGPPGVGKSLAAKWLSREVGLDLATLNLAAVINSFLGKTGQNLASVLDYARGNPCVLFLDEFDALAKRRDDNQDVGELKRVVNVLLQAVDQWQAPSMLVAATNHAHLLDHAMFRRFDIVIAFPEVTRKQAAESLVMQGVPPALAMKLAKSMTGQPLSDIYRRLAMAKKHSLLSGTPFERALQHVWGTDTPKQSKIEHRRTSVRILHNRGLSTREIAEKLGVSHSTVVRDINAD